MRGSRNKEWLLLMVLVLLLSFCSLKRGDSAKDSPALFSEKKIGRYTFRIEPIPASKLIAIHYGKDKFQSLRSSERDSIVSEYEQYVCFLFEIEIDDYSGDIAEYEHPDVKMEMAKRLNYFLFDMQKDFSLLDNKGTVYPCRIYYFQRLSEMTKRNQFIVGFDKPVHSEVLSFQYENSALNCGPVKMILNNEN